MPEPTIQNYVKLQLIKMNLIEEKDYSTINLIKRNARSDYECDGYYWQFKTYYKNDGIFCHIIDMANHSQYSDWFYEHNYDYCKHLSYFEMGSQRLMMYADFF